MRTAADPLLVAVALSVSAACSGPAKEAEEATEPTVEEGFSLTTGLFAVGPGEETQDCYFFEVPFDDTRFIQKISLSMNDGSHHMNVFRVKTETALRGRPGDVVRGGECWVPGNWKEWPLVVNTQNDGSLAFDLPSGVATRFEPRELLMLQTHYINVASQPTPDQAEVTIDFFGLPESEVKAELGTVFATNQNIEVCPGEQRSYTRTCMFGLPEEATIVGANGHFHARGKRFTMNSYDGQVGALGQFYESSRWDDPIFARELDVTIPAGGGIQWTCDFEAGPEDCGDPENGCCYTFGGHVEAQEHCNAFVYYYPVGPSSINCF